MGKEKTWSPGFAHPHAGGHAVTATWAEKMPALVFESAPAPAVPLRSPYFTEVSHPHVTETKSGEEGMNICQLPGTFVLAARGWPEGWRMPRGWKCDSQQLETLTHAWGHPLGLF